MPERVYISDADLQSASDIEIIRLSRTLVAAMNSSFPGKRKKIIEKIREHARANPYSTIPFLLRYYDHVDPNTREYARMLIEELTRLPGGEQALIESIFSSHTSVGDSAAAVLEARNMDGMRFRELYLDAERQFSSCKAAGVYTDDVKDLFLEAIRLYKNKLVEQAFENIILVSDILKDRLEWTSNTKRYIQDVLKLTPQLSRSGVSIDNLQESLKILAGAVKTRDYKETKDLLESKKLEASVVSQIGSVLSFLSKRLKSAQLELSKRESVSSEDQRMFDSMKNLGAEVKSYVKKKKRVEALEGIYSFVSQELAGKYVGDVVRRMESGDSNAELAAGQMMVGLLKILSLLLPNAASEMFEMHLKSKVGKESIEDTPWPHPLKSLD
ncbi:MAG: hypothetical protein QW505_06190 [Thermoplasmata archaeon]